MLVAILLTLAVRLAIVQASCGYGNCPSGGDEYLNVHLVAHSHNDVGWVKTVDQYFNNEVQFILDSTVKALSTNPEYRFIYAEMVFFQRWWNMQSDHVKDIVRHLVAEGRLQFVKGGWSMADEATVYYGDEVDQLTLGRNFLKDLFGECGISKIAWQIDAFGHSLDRADLYIDAGYDGLFFQRMDHMEKAQRRWLKEMELLWNTYGTRALFTHIMYDSYCHPPNLCFDTKCGSLEYDDHILNAKAAAMQELLLKYDQTFRYNHVMLPMGCDFTFTHAGANFKALDRVMRAVNGTVVNGRRINIFYSTPACYLKAINIAVRQSSQPLPIRNGDFFPYADRAHNYWTGYYTSRPAFKEFVRQSSRLLTVAEQFNVFASNSEDSDAVDQLRQQLGIIQHHDAVTGTEKQFVVEDYINHVYRASKLNEALIVRRLAELMGDIGKWELCTLKNQSVCEASVSQHSKHEFLVTIYNPLSWALNRLWERIPLYVEDINNTVVHIQDLSAPDEAKLGQQLVFIPKRKVNTDYQRHAGNVELVFSPTSGDASIPALGYKTYRISVHPGKPSAATPPSCDITDSGVNQFEFDLDHDDYTIRVRARDRSTNQHYDINVGPAYYLGEMTHREVSGAYVFRPAVDQPIKYFQNVQFKVTRGPCVDQIEATYDDWMSLTVRRYADQQLEVEWFLGPMPEYFKNSSKEIVIRYVTESTDALSPCESGLDPSFKSSLKCALRIITERRLSIVNANSILSKKILDKQPDQNTDASTNHNLSLDIFQRGLNREFYTDSDGRRLIRRVRTKRNDDYSDQISSNYYPVLNRIMLKGCANSSRALAMAVYTDRAEGGSSLHDGLIELMLHRRLLVDDHLGVKEPLMEDYVNGDGAATQGNSRLKQRKKLARHLFSNLYRDPNCHVRGVHRLVFDQLSSVEKADRQRATEVVKPPLSLFKKSPDTPKPGTRFMWSALNQPLPENIYLISLISWPLVPSRSNSTQGQLLLRFENLNSPTRQPVDQTLVDLTYLLQGIRVLAATEVTITADQSKTKVDNERLTWGFGNQRLNAAYGSSFDSQHGTVKVPVPVDTIRSYIVDYSLLESAF